MKPQNINDLTPNVKNPRKISDHDFKSLKASIQKFGDLSGIVYNRRTEQLVGGHQRVEAFKALGLGPDDIPLQELPKANSVGTVARGQIMMGDEPYTYRVVDWPAELETAANIAANRVQGEFDFDLLAEMTYELNSIDPDLVALTGQTQDEVDQLIKSVGGATDPTGGEDKVDNSLYLKFDAAQLEVVNTAIYNSKHQNNIVNGSMDETTAEALFLICRDYIDTQSSDVV